MTATSHKPPATPPRSLAPKEHGAYGQLAVPMLTVLAARAPSLSALLFACAAWAAFMAHEPILVLLGHRGTKTRALLQRPAQRRCILLSLIACGCGALGLWFAPFSARMALFVPFGGALLFLPILRAKREKTLLGESFAACILCFAAFPIGLASSLPFRGALSVSIIFSLAFIAATWAVRAIIHHGKRAMSSWARTWPILIHGAVFLVLPAIELVPWRNAAAGLPMLLFSLAITLWPPSPTALRKVGLALVFTSLLSALGLILALHHPTA